MDEKEKLLKVLKEHKTAIGWSISDLKGINHSFCTHKMLMEDNVKHVRQSQRRLNPTKKEIHQWYEEQCSKSGNWGRIHGNRVGVVGCVLWWWNELWYVVPLRVKCSASGTKLPRGHMGFPFVGEMISFLWYFKFLGRPDDFINAKRRKYGDGVGMFRTHLFGSPTMIVYTPPLNKFVLHSEDKFKQEWPTVELMGTASMLAVHGKAHARVRSFVTNSINRPDSLRRIALLVQPRIVNALQSWAKMGKINARVETHQLGIQNIGKLFASMEPGPLLHSLDKLIHGMLPGLRAYPLNFPGFAYHHAFQCRKKIEDIFWMELGKRKNETEGEIIDLMDGLMRIEDDEGHRLSDIEVVHNIVSLMIGGYVSTALVSMWAIYLLAKYPTVLRKLREENTAFKKGSPGDFITAEDVSNLTYTNKVVEETIRMANVASFVFRKVEKEINYKGYKIPKGWKVICFLRYFQTNPENFKDPMYFNPDRWNEPAKPGTYQVFGAGQRLCPGNTLARIQLALLLHHLSIGYKWELLNPNADMIYLSHPAPVDGVEVKFSKL
ncbi:ent-kaurenoic acid oxidase 2-like [Gastrolobium bilobum]|uniref:ent-kaurenoic acid oxidase 2-like n=1 Tax=Gastrolobium bilobum TaxID=150636 RepID=UPI002AAF6F51|nr:ent-kaurenoic acid oxidase 2-like [Gastrolobium bilobum]